MSISHLQSYLIIYPFGHKDSAENYIDKISKPKTILRIKNETKNLSNYFSDLKINKIGNKQKNDNNYKTTEQTCVILDGLDQSLKIIQQLLKTSRHYEVLLIVLVSNN